MLVCWILFPALLGLIAQGCGSVVERLAGMDLTLGARIPCGVALVIAVMDLATRWPATADLAVGAVLVLAALGLVLSPPWRWSWHRSAPALVAALIVFAVYAAPIVLSGMATWAGYIKLDDTATWLALVDRALTHGRSVAGLPLSSYRATLEAYLTAGYPIGSFLPMGIGHALLGEDDAWLVNPWMAFLAATLALALHRIARLALGERAPAWRPLAIAALAAQPALLYGYYLWGGIKELAAATLIGAFAVAMPLALRGRLGLRKVLPAAVVIWALIAALSPGGLVYAGPGFVLALLAWGSIWLLRRSSGRPLAELLPGSPRAWAAWLVPLTALAAGAYLVLRPGGFVERFSATLTGGDELGNLVKPLSLQQLAGIWPVGDFRFPPALPTLTHIVVILVVICALYGLVLALRDGRLELILYLLCALAGALLTDLLASPWVTGKALASASPALPFAALTALAWPGGLGRLLSVAWAHLARHASPSPAPPAGSPSAAPSRGSPSAAPRAGESSSATLHAGKRALAGLGASPGAAKPVLAGLGALAAFLFTGGILWSNLLAYHDVSLAPRTQFEELAEIGSRIKGQGPTLMTEFQPYGARHFLREAAPEAVSELRMRDDPLLSGELLPPGSSTDIDQVQLSSVLVYRTIVLQRSPVASRPPSPYRLILADRFWEVWQRPPTLATTILWHLPLGDPTQPGAIPSCPALLRMARQQGVATVVAEPVEDPLVISLETSHHPANWSLSGEQIYPEGSGSDSLTVDVPRAGRYSIWLGGSTRGPLSVYVDGTRLSRALYEIQEAGQYLPFGQISLQPGPHTVQLRYGGEGWRPGVGGRAEPLGPLVLRRETTARGDAISRSPLITLPAKDASSLCGQTLDWVEGLS